MGMAKNKGKAAGVRKCRHFQVSPGVLLFALNPWAPGHVPSRIVEVSIACPQKGKSGKRGSKRSVTQMANEKQMKTRAKTARI